MTSWMAAGRTLREIGRWREREAMGDKFRWCADVDLMLIIAGDRERVKARPFRRLRRTFREDESPEPELCGGGLDRRLEDESGSLDAPLPTTGLPCNWFLPRCTSSSVSSSVEVPESELLRI